MFYIIRAYKDKSELLWAIRLERKTRLELATPTLARLCSTNWAISAECEEEETRTPTSQLTLPPQSSASTNSATSPTCKCILNNVPRTGLEPARRETHAPETCASTNSATWAGIEETFFLMLYSECMSGKRDSNPRPRPWQGRALPTELFPQLSFAGAFL